MERSRLTRPASLGPPSPRIRERCKTSSPSRAALIPSAPSPLLRGALAGAPQDEAKGSRGTRPPQDEAAFLRLGLILRCEQSEPRRIEAKPRSEEHTSELQSRGLISHA